MTNVNFKKTICAAMAALMAVTAAGCGSTDAEDTSKAETTSAAVTEAVSEETEPVETTAPAETEAPAVETEEEITEEIAEEEAEVDESSYDYYKDLAAAYEENGRSSYGGALFNGIARDYKHSIVGMDNGIVWSVDENGEGHIVLDTNDVKETEEVFDVVTSGGYIYYTIQDIRSHNDFDVHLIKLDMEGNEVASTELPEESVNYAYIGSISPDGHVIMFYKYEGELHIWDPELKEERELTENPHYTDAYGDDKVKCGDDIHYMTLTYNNKVFYSPDVEEGAVLDLDTLKWDYFDLPEVLQYGFVAPEAYGKYMINGYCVVNLETFDVISDNDRDDFKYYGGDCDIKIENGKATFAQFGDMGGRRIVKTYDNIKGEKVYPVDSEKYVEVNNLGVFLHTFEKGDSEKTEVVSFK